MSRLSSGFAGSLWLAGLLLAVAGTSVAMTPTSSANFSIGRSNTNNGGATQATGNFRVTPQIVGYAVAGISNSGSFRIEHGGLAPGGTIPNRDDVYVDPFWLAQADVENDPTVGVFGGCNPPVGNLLALGFNAFSDIPSALAVVNPGGRVHLMNATHPLTATAVVGVSATILGEDESVGACAGLDGRAGAFVQSDVSPFPGSTLFEVNAPSVLFEQLTMLGGSSLAPLVTEVASAVSLQDATATNGSLAVVRADLRYFGGNAIEVLAPGTSGHLVRDVDISEMGPAYGGSPDATGVLIGGADGRVETSNFTSVPNGIRVAGGQVAGLPPVTGSAYIPDVVTFDNRFLSIGAPFGPGLGNAAVSYTGGVTGLVDDNTVDVAAIGVLVRENLTSGTVTVSNNILRGPARIGVHVDEFGAVAPGSQAVVEVTTNTLTGGFELAGMSVQYVGMDDTGTPGETAVVSVKANQATGLDGPTVADQPWGLHVRGVASSLTNFSRVEVEENLITSAGGTARGGILVELEDTVTGEPSRVDTASVSLVANTVSGPFPEGIRLGQLPQIGGQSGAVTVSNSAPLPGNTVDGAGDNIVVGSDFLVAITDSASTTTQVISNATGNGIRLQGGGSSVVVAGNGIERNQVGILWEGDTIARVEDNQITTSGSLASVGVAATSLAGILDLGGGVAGSTGGNVFNVTDAGDWAVVASVAGAISGEANTWQFQGVTYNGAVSVDDLILDGDADNLAAGGEAAGVGPFDFIPFVGATEPAVTVDAAAVRGTTPGYGRTVVRALSDGVEAVSASGGTTVLAGDYVSLTYDAGADYVVPEVVIDRALTLSASGVATVYPGVNAPGSNVDTILEPGAATLLRVLASDVTINGLRFDGDSPLLAGGAAIGGADINARNAVVLDGNSPLGAPSNIIVTDALASNFLYKGVATNPVIGQVHDNVSVTSSTFENIQAINLLTGASAAVDLAEVSNTFAGYNQASRVGTGLSIDPADVVSTNTIALNTVSDNLVAGAAARGVNLGSRVVIDSNVIAPLETSLSAVGLLVQDVDTSGTVLATGNLVSDGNTGAVVATVRPSALVEITSNDFASTGTLDGILVRDSIPLTTETLVLLADNTITGYTTGIRVADTGLPGGLADAPSSGTLAVRNILTDNGTAVAVDGTLQPVGAFIGDGNVANANRIEGSTVGVLVSHPNAFAWVSGNDQFTSNSVGIRVDSGAAAMLLANRFDNHTTAAIEVANAGSQALIQSNYMLGSTNQVGIHLTDDALASMGPGLPANNLTDPRFGTMVSSIGYNVLRDYTGVPSSFAIVNNSSLDQNAEQNDFGTLACDVPDAGGPPYIEDWVIHVVDNPLFGEVLFCPPLVPFTTIRDWMDLDAQ
jgi:hypothetical protein